MAFTELGWTEKAWEVMQGFASLENPLAAGDHPSARGIAEDRQLSTVVLTAWVRRKRLFTEHPLPAISAPFGEASGRRGCHLVDARPGVRCLTRRSLSGGGAPLFGGQPRQPWGRGTAGLHAGELEREVAGINERRGPIRREPTLKPPPAYATHFSLQGRERSLHRASTDRQGRLWQS